MWVTKSLNRAEFYYVRIIDWLFSVQQHPNIPVITAEGNILAQQEVLYDDVYSSCIKEIISKLKLSF